MVRIYCSGENRQTPRERYKVLATISENLPTEAEMANHVTGELAIV